MLLAHLQLFSCFNIFIFVVSYGPSWPDAWLIFSLFFIYFYVLLLLCILTFEGCISVKIPK